MARRTEAPPGPDLSVVVPIHNEVESLPFLLQALHPVLESLGKTWEALLVDDGSTDGSGQELQALKRRDPRLRVISLQPRQGQSAAFWSGFTHARGRVLVTLDADLQNDPQDIPVLLEALEAADLVVGWRHERLDPAWKRVTARVANVFRNCVMGERIHDVGCSLKAFRREVVEHFFPFRGMHRFFPSLAEMAGFRVVEVKVRHRPRKHGRSKYGTLDRLWGAFVDCFGVWWMKRRSLGRLEGRESPVDTAPVSGGAQDPEGRSGAW